MRIEVKVMPRSKRHEIVEEEGRLKAYLRSAPEKGKANKELVELIAQKYNVKRSSVCVIKGTTSRTKVVEVAER